MSFISFINEDALMKQFLQECPICKKSYLKQDFAQCDKCKGIHCLKCTILAGILGTICKNCFKKLPKEEQDKIGKKAKKLHFWAKNGYYGFCILAVLTFFSFSLFFLYSFFFVLGAILAISTVLYGYFLFKYLSRGR